MKVAKRFRWEAAHRLPWHEGPCRSLHGHSYRMVVELDGRVDERGMMMDFQDLKRCLQPVVDAWDHAVLVSETDGELLALLDQTDWKRAVLPFDTTSENLAAYVARHLCVDHAALLRSHRVERVRVRIEETDTCYAEAEQAVVLSPADAPMLA